MKTIIFGFSVPKHKSAFAKLIMWVEKTPYDHVYVKWTWAAIERDVIYQASKLSVNFESNLTFDTHALAIEEYEITISDECHKRVMQFCMDNSNKPYGVKEIFGFGWVKLCAALGQKVHNPFPTHGHSYICSKIGAEILSLIGSVKIESSLDDIGPLDFQRIISAAADMGLAKKIL